MDIRLGGVATPPPVTMALYAALGGPETTSDLYVIDTVTAAGTSVGAIGFALTGLAFRAADNVLFGVTNNNSASNPRSLITVDPNTGAGTLVGALGVVNGIADIAFLGSALYGYTPSTRTLYTIDTSTGSATQVSATAIPITGSGYGLSFDSTGTLYVFPKQTNGVFYIVDETTGALTAQPSLTGTPASTGPVASASFDTSDVLWATEFSGATTYLLTIDVVAATTSEVAPTITNLDALAWGPA